MKILSITFSSIFLIFSNQIQAQSFYMNYGASGGEFSAFMIFDENSNIYLGPKIGYSFNGQLDLGVKLGVNILDKSEFIDNQSSLDITPYFLLHFFKQGDNGMPLSVLTGIGYRYGKSNIDINPTGSSEISTNYVVMTYGLYRDFIIENTIRIQPRFIFELYVGQTESTISNINETVEEQEAKPLQYFEISLPIIYRPSEKNNYFFSPSISFSEGTTMYGFYLGLTF